MDHWKRAQEGRDVWIVGGDVHEGGWTDIICGDDSKRFIRQLTTSAIANKSTKPHEAIAVTLTRDAGAILDGFKLVDEWKCWHYDWTNKRNYAILSLEQDGGGGALIKAHLVAGDEECVKDLAEKTGKDKAKDWYAACLGAGCEMGPFSLSHLRNKCRIIDRIFIRRNKVETEFVVVIKLRSKSLCDSCPWMSSC